VSVFQLVEFPEADDGGISSYGVATVGRPDLKIGLKNLNVGLVEALVLKEDVHLMNDSRRKVHV